MNSATVHLDRDSRRGTEDEYGRATRRTTYVGLVLAALIAVIVGLGYWQARPPLATVDAMRVSVQSGFFRVDIPLAEVRDVELISMLPPIGSRQRGYMFGRAYRGRFATARDSSVLVYVTTGAPPYLAIKTTAIPLVVNLADAEQTRALHATLRSRLVSR